MKYLEDILVNNRIGDNYFDSQGKGVWNHIGQSVGGLESSKNTGLDAITTKYPQLISGNVFSQHIDSIYLIY